MTFRSQGEFELALADFLAARATASTRRALQTDPLGAALAKALTECGWQPPGPRQRGGLTSGRVRGDIQTTRQIAVDTIMRNLPPEYRDHPRRPETVARVQAGLRQLAAVIPIIGQRITAANSTIKTDLHQLGYRHKKRTKRTAN